ncbi:uncharacterized protein [Leptinotarsa decemlineata]|uniref:uncharacterized protein n=1 Tax=Leptinotarsa decemlineata TaxID=7539 RepID=UPI003D3062E8
MSSSNQEILQQIKYNISPNSQGTRGKQQLFRAESIHWRTVHSFYIKNEIPTLNKVLSVIREDNDPDLPHVGRTKLWQVLEELNFRWEKSDRKSLLIDREEIICWRRKYLRSIRKFRAEGRPIYYQDGTWVNAGHTLTKIWTDKNISSSRQAFMEGWSTGISPPSGKGSRLIVSHIGSEKGFAKHGLLKFEKHKRLSRGDDS